MRALGRCGLRLAVLVRPVVLALAALGPGPTFRTLLAVEMLLALLARLVAPRLSQRRLVAHARQIGTWCARGTWRSLVPALLALAPRPPFAAVPLALASRLTRVIACVLPALRPAWAVASAAMAIAAPIVAGSGAPAAPALLA